MAQIRVNNLTFYYDGSFDDIFENFSGWWENKQRKDRFVMAENEKHQKEIRKLKQAARQTAEWADKNERTKIGFDPIKEHDRFLDTRAYIGAKTKKMQSRVSQMEKRLWKVYADQADPAESG